MNKHFILAEDDEDDVALFLEAIKSAKVPIHVTTVLSCDDIMGHLSPHELPQLVIMDTSLPGKSALECIAAIRAAFTAEQLPVMVLSTSLPSSLQVKGYIAGFNLMLKKPDTFKEVQKLVRRLYLVEWANHPALTLHEFYQLDI
ncbi:MAG TPA: response regulator [Segetibacter sp.]|jgi:DNA-binding response OmpR family regulator